MTFLRSLSRALAHASRVRPRAGAVLAAALAAAILALVPVVQDDGASAKKAAKAKAPAKAKAKTRVKAKDHANPRKRRAKTPAKAKDDATPRKSKAKTPVKAKDDATDAGESGPKGDGAEKPAETGGETEGFGEEGVKGGAGKPSKQGLPGEESSKESAEPAGSGSAGPAPVAATPSGTGSTAPPSTQPTARSRRRAAARRRVARARRVRSRAAPRRTSAGPTPSVESAPGLVPIGDVRSGVAPEKQPRPEPEGDNGGSPVAPVTRTVREIVEVVPEAAQRLLAALVLLSGVLGGGYLLSTFRARRLARQRGELLQEVGLLQTALLPPVPETMGAVRASVAYRPSDGPGAGGDFYDALTLPGGRAAFILGDVSGHGRAALARTAFMRYTLRAYLEAGLEPRQVLQVAGRVVEGHLGGDFATVVVAVHDPSTGSLVYACAGHPAPIVVGGGRVEPILAASSPPIGMGLRTGLRQTSLPVPPGTVVCLYTDGLAEARTEHGVLGRPHLADIVEELGRDITAPDLLEQVGSEARLVSDDMATVVFTPTAGVTAGGFRTEQLEVDASEIEDGIAEQFLRACGAVAQSVDAAVVEMLALSRTHGGVILHVRFGIRGPHVEVLPRNVESLEAASLRPRAAAL